MNKRGIEDTKQKKNKKELNEEGAVQDYCLRIIKEN